MERFEDFGELMKEFLNSFKLLLTMAMKPVAFLHLLNDFFTLVDALVDRLLVGDTVLPAYLIFFVLHMLLVGLVGNVY